MSGFTWNRATRLFDWAFFVFLVVFMMVLTGSFAWMSVRFAQESSWFDASMATGFGLLSAVVAILIVRGRRLLFTP